MRLLYDCFKEEKSEADKLFEELGYKKNDREDCWLEYNREQFEVEKKIAFEKNNHVFFVENKIGESMPVDIKELEAIIIKCVEFRLDRRRR